MRSPLAGSSILVTGGTGSFGSHFVEQVLKDYEPARIAVFSRDELKQYEMQQKFDGEDRVRFFLGDIRDRERLRLAMHDVDFVVHAAALKQVDTAEYNPTEYIQTNVLGSQNVILSAIDAGVSKVVALSTDKASSPINLYGASKLMADRLFVSANHYGQARGVMFSVVRYGNVAGSRGSVIPLFRNLAHRGEPISITDTRMTRFWLTLDQAVSHVIRSFARMNGGELFVPRIPSARITDLAEAIAPGREIVEIGLRPGEKLHEEMISSHDAPLTIEQEDVYIVSPSVAAWTFEMPEGNKVAEGFRYSSDTNDWWLSVNEIREMLRYV